MLISVDFRIGAFAVLLSAEILVVMLWTCRPSRRHLWSIGRAWVELLARRRASWKERYDFHRRHHWRLTMRAALPSCRLLHLWRLFGTAALTIRKAQAFKNASKLPTISFWIIRRKCRAAVLRVRMKSSWKKWTWMLRLENSCRQRPLRPLLHCQVSRTLIRPAANRSNNPRRSSWIRDVKRTTQCRQLCQQDRLVTVITSKKKLRTLWWHPPQ